MDDKEIMRQLEEQAGEGGADIKIDNSSFASKDAKEPEKKTEAKEEATVVPTFEESMKKLGTSKDEIVDMIMELSDSGFIRKDISLLGGKLTAVFKSSKLTDTKEFVEMFDDMSVNTQSKADYYLSIFSLASVLNQYKDSSLEGMDVIARADWIAMNIPSPMYKILLREAGKFHGKIELLSSEEVTSFF